MKAGTKGALSFKYLHIRTFLQNAIIYEIFTHHHRLFSVVDALLCTKTYTEKLRQNEAGKGTVIINHSPEIDEVVNAKTSEHNTKKATPAKKTTHTQGAPPQRSHLRTQDTTKLNTLTTLLAKTREQQLMPMTEQKASIEPREGKTHLNARTKAHIHTFRVQGTKREVSVFAYLRAATHAQTSKKPFKWDGSAAKICRTCRISKFRSPTLGDARR